jgi:hypothetical protein
VCLQILSFYFDLLSFLNPGCCLTSRPPYRLHHYSPSIVLLKEELCAQSNQTRTLTVLHDSKVPIRSDEAGCIYKHCGSNLDIHLLTITVRTNKLQVYFSVASYSKKFWLHTLPDLARFRCSKIKHRVLACSTVPAVTARRLGRIRSNGHTIITHHVRTLDNITIPAISPFLFPLHFQGTRFQCRRSGN